MPRDWQGVVQDDEFSDVQRLVHLAMRMDIQHEASLQAALTDISKNSFEKSLTEMSKAAGCTGRKGLLTDSNILSQLNDSSVQIAKSVTNTYNFDLATAIIGIRATTPTANRFTYAKSLKDWDKTRSEWKSRQVSLNTTLQARSLAQAEFMSKNPDLQGFAILEGPNPAQEAICQGWLNRGRVPIQVALENPSPFHTGCPHPWRFVFTKLGRKAEKEARCEDMWLGTTS